MSNIKYRYDIDGLRAIAVLAVIINHANAAWLPGGFVGVDVFFVISGFLISSIIYPQIENQKFTLIQFYTRRVKRLLPALFFMLFSVLVVGWLLFLPDDFTELTRSARYTAFFTSNLFFADNTDYFAAAIYETPLVHTWSLAVEEQFYIFWPLMLITLLTVKKQLLVPATVLLIIASVALATVTAANPMQAMFSFYQLPTRMGELLIGALLAFTIVYLPESKTLKNLAAVLGVALIVGSFWLINSDTIFPGIHALWPCVGAAAIIYSGYKNNGALQRLLAQRFMVLIGAMSYSLYLWHWPTLSFARYYTMQVDLSWQVLVLCAAVTFLMAYIAWRLVEEPFRYSKLSFKQTLIRYLLVPGMLVLAVGLFAKSHYFLGSATLEQEKDLLNRIGCVNKIRPSCNAVTANSQKSELLVLGDSHARHFAYLFQSLGIKHNVGVDLVASNGCAFLLDPSVNVEGKCENLYHYISENIASYPQLLIVHSWSQYFNASESLVYQKNLEVALQQSSKRNQKVFLLEQVPNYQKNVMRAHYYGHSNQRLESYQTANKILADIAKAYDNVQIISVNEFAEKWLDGGLDSQAFYLDNNHLTLSAQKQLIEDLLSHPDNSLAKLLRQLKTESIRNHDINKEPRPK